MIMIKRIAVVATLAALIAPLPAMAQAPARIAFVNVARLVSESPQATAAMEELQEEFAPRQREIVAMQNAFREKQEQVQRDLEVMGPEERLNAERDLRKEERELGRRLEEINEDANLRRNEELAQLQREVLQEVAAYAREIGYDLVIGEGVLFASSTVDITPQVLERLQASFGKAD